MSQPLPGKSFEIAHRIFDLGDQTGICLGMRGVLHPRQIPVFRVVQICKTTVDQGAYMIETERSQGMTFKQALRLRRARLGGKFRRIDQIATKTRQFDTVAGFAVGRTWLGVLACKTAYSHHPLFEPVGQYQTHLQQHTQAIGNDVATAFVKRLGAITALKHKTLAACSGRKFRAQRIDLARGHQRRTQGQRIGGALERIGVRIAWLLQDRAITPAVRCPERHAQVRSMMGCALSNS